MRAAWLVGVATRHDQMTAAVRGLKQIYVQEFIPYTADQARVWAVFHRPSECDFKPLDVAREDAVRLARRSSARPVEIRGCTHERLHSRRKFAPGSRGGSDAALDRGLDQRPLD